MDLKNKKSKIIKKNIKSSVFTHLFSLSKYKKELYLVFHPNDKNIKEEEIKTWTLSSVFTNVQINDLGYLVKDTILFIMEAQSIWTLNILPRIFEYLGESFNRYIIESNQNVYGTKKVKLPKPELYVLYTGKTEIKEKTISLNKEFYNNKSPIDIKVNVLTIKNATKILKEYIKFSKIIDKNNKKYNWSKKSINETIKYCIEHNILKEYLNEYKKEVYNIMISVYDQKTATDMYGNERYTAGKKEGIAVGIEQGIEKGIEQGIEEGKLNTLIKLYKKGLIQLNDIMQMIDIKKEKFLKLVK